MRLSGNDISVLTALATWPGYMPLTALAPFTGLAEDDAFETAVNLAGLGMAEADGAGPRAGWRITSHGRGALDEANSEAAARIGRSEPEARYFLTLETSDDRSPLELGETVNGLLAVAGFPGRVSVTEIDSLLWAINHGANDESRPIAERAAIVRRAWGDHLTRKFAAQDAAREEQDHR